MNIAEGSGAGTDAEFSRFLQMSQRSAYEVITALEIVIVLELFNKNTLDGLIGDTDEPSAMLSGLLKRLKAES